MLDGIYYTPEELSKRFRLSLSTIYNLLEKGQIPSVKLGKSYRIPEKGLDDYLKVCSRHSKDLPSAVKEFLRVINNSNIKNDILDIILYGSYARGNYNKDSDIDILVTVRELSNKLYDSISEMSDMAMQASNYDDFLSVIQVSEKQWEETGRLKTPFYNSVIKEGISLWKST